MIPVSRTLALRIVVVAVVYVAAARFGLRLDAVGGFAALVWAPSGIALAAVLLFRSDIWPAIALGAFTANLWSGAPIIAAIAIAAGNTGEALVGAWALRKLPDFRARLDRVVDVLSFLALAGVASTLISATVGVTSLVATGVIPRAEALYAFRAWWLGDLVGIVVVVPVILAWYSNRQIVKEPRRVTEIVVLSLAVVGAAIVTFVRLTPLAPIVVPVMIWAALRFGPRGATTASLFIAIIAIWATVRGTGPFAHAELHGRLLALQVFLAILTSTFLILSASFSERRRAEADAIRAEQQAEKANAAKADFLAVMSHELRTPLNAITGYVDLLITEIQGPITAKQKDSLERIQRNGRHLLMLIEDVLTFAKVEAGRVVIHPRVFSVDEALDSIEPLIQPQMAKKRLRYTRLTRDRSLSVIADPEKLRQILLNLLSNAAKYTPEDGEVRIGAERRGTRMVFWVSDTGVGIPADQLVRVFEPFYQVDRGTTRTYPGIGLGLTITRDLARAMDGDVTVESVAGIGTTVKVILPAAERRNSRPLSAIPIASAPGV